MARTASDIRATRQALRELEWAKRDAEAVEWARADQRVDAAALAAVELLPGGVGAAIAALFEAMKPWRASDGYLSSSAIGRSSPEVLALAEALLAAPALGLDHPAVRGEGEREDMPDELQPYLDEAMKRPGFRAAYEAAEKELNES